METYEETVSWLFHQFPSYQNIGAPAYKPTLENTRKLLSFLGNPEKNLKFIHLAGTNGKGSCCHLLSSIFIEHNYKTGLFTSPHLIDFRERIKVDGQEISKDFVFRFIHRIQGAEFQFSPSFFEISFAMALCYFSEQNCNICVIETGLGGRLDATNVIVPLLSVITNIGLDHQQFLGNTRKEIAGEKAGILKENVPVLIAERDAETELVFTNKANALHSPLYWVDFSLQLNSGLNGHYQRKNTATAYAAAKIIQNQLSLDEIKIRLGLSNVQRNCPIRARMEIMQKNPMVVIDAAHNEEGVVELMRSLNDFNYHQLHLVYGASSDKRIEFILKHIPKEAHIYFTQFANARSASVQTFKALSNTIPQSCDFFISPKEAYTAAIQHAKQEDLVLIFGSFFLLEEFYDFFV
jgi:dihydrofolate synthase/folylpolyglutamate synthase